MSNNSGSLIPSVGWSPDVKGVETDLDSMGRGKATPIEGNDVVLTVDIPHESGNIIAGVGWNPKS